MDNLCLELWNSLAETNICVREIDRLHVNVHIFSYESQSLAGDRQLWIKSKI